jgi:hypothetical protein
MFKSFGRVTRFGPLLILAAFLLVACGSGEVTDPE